MVYNPNLRIVIKTTEYKKEFCCGSENLFCVYLTRFILRNYIAENAIKAAEEGDYTEVQRVYKLLQNPYSEQLDMDISFTDQMIARWDSSSQSSNSGKWSFFFFITDLHILFIGHLIAQLGFNCTPT